jgi:hypothetical protein
MLCHTMPQVVPVEDAKCLDVNFPVPALDPHYRALPMRYIRWGGEGWEGRGERG